jgi:hypothetical protein
LRFENVGNTYPASRREHAGRCSDIERGIELDRFERLGHATPYFLSSPDSVLRARGEYEEHTAPRILGRAAPRMRLIGGNR